MRAGPSRCLFALASASLVACSRKEPPPSDRIDELAAARGGTTRLAAIEAARLSGTLALRRPGAEEQVQAFVALFRFPERARFTFTVGHANRLLLLRPDGGDERLETAGAFEPLTPAAFEEWRAALLVHAIAARFPVLPLPLTVALDGETAVVLGMRRPARVSIDPKSRLPASVSIEGDDRSFALGDWTIVSGSLSFPASIRCDQGDHTLWDERIETWETAVSISGRLFDRPRGTSSPAGPSVKTGEFRIVDEPAISVAAAAPVSGWAAVAGALRDLRKDALRDAKAMVVCAARGAPVEVVLIPTGPVEEVSRTIEATPVAEVFYQGSLADLEAWIAKLRDFAAERELGMGEEVRVFRNPDSWEDAPGARVLHRIALPLSGG